MTPELTSLGVGVGLLLVGAVLRGHAPRVWKLIGPVFGAVEQGLGVTPPPASPPPANPTEPPAAGGLAALSPRPKFPPYLTAVSLPDRDPDARFEEHLAEYLRRKQRPGRIRLMIEAARDTAEGGAKPTAVGPTPSAN